MTAERKFEVGSKVKAMFDGEHWPATVVGIFKSGKYKVEFEDGTYANLEEGDLQAPRRGRPAAAAAVPAKAAPAKTPATKTKPAPADPGVSVAAITKAMGKLIDEKLAAFHELLLSEITDLMLAGDEDLEEEELEEEEEEIPAPKATRGRKAKQPEPEEEEEEEEEELEEEEEEEPAPKKSTRGRKAKQPEPEEEEEELEEEDDTDW